MPSEILHSLTEGFAKPDPVIPDQRKELHKDAYIHVVRGVSVRSVEGIVLHSDRRNQIVIRKLVTVADFCIITRDNEVEDFAA